jgi:diguanylate cyclase (GGDEF)-like protein/PAS domain S-box-containing protein
MASFSIFDSMLDGVFVVTNEGKIAYCNEVFAGTLDVSPRRIINKDVDKVFADQTRFMDPISAVLKGEQDVTPYIEFEFKRPDGQEKKVQVSAQKYEDHALVYVRDTSLETLLYAKYRRELGQKEDLIVQLNRKVFELEFLLSSASLDSTQNSGQLSKYSVLAKVHEGLGTEFICTYLVAENSHGGWSVWEKESYRGTESEENDLQLCIQQDLERWQKADIGKIFEKDSYIIEQRLSCVVTCAVRSKNGDLHLYSYHFTKNNSAGIENAKLLDSLTKQTGMLLENQELFNQSITDEKTKLYNQRYLNYRFDQEVTRSKRHKHEFALFVFDIDHFKKFNDTYGHLVGDQVLIEVAKVIRHSFRSTDITARFGGEEFVVLVVETHIDNALDLANKVRETIKNNTVTTSDGKQLTVTVSIGVAYFPHHGMSPKELFEAADQALYKAKANGRNRVELASPRDK